MSVFSKFLQLSGGVARTVDLSSNELGTLGLQLNGSSSGEISQYANASTTSYSVYWPASQGAASSFLQNDGSGNMFWGTLASAPTISNNFVAGETFSANTSYIVRWAMNSLSETTNEIFKADYDETSSDDFWAIGIAFSSTTMTAGQNINVYSFGAYTLGSNDTPFSTGDIGKPVWLTSAGAFSTTPPTGSNEADFKIGIVISTTKIWLDGQMMGIGNSSGGVPAYPTAVTEGGTGLSSMTAYALLAGGTTSTGALQQISGLGTSGQVLTSNGSSALPTWQNSGSSFTFSDSLVNNSGTVTLVNDSASPGNSQYYGTNSSGTLGYFSIPSSANQALSNLSSVAINTSLLPSSNDAIDLGSSSKAWRNVYAYLLEFPSGASISLQNGQSLDSSGQISLDWQNRLLDDTSGVNSIDYANRYIKDSSAVISVDYGNRLLEDHGGNVSVDYDNRYLKDASAAIQLSWSTSGVELNQLTASTVPYLNSSKVLVSSSVTPTQLSYLDATSSIQTQLNGKQATGNYITALTGDATASGPGSAALTLATVNSNTGSFGSASSVSTFTVNAKGLITAAGSTSIQIAQSQVTGLSTTLSGYLPLSGGTMSGAIAMGSNKITGLASGTTSGDALQYGQIGVANGIAGLDSGGKVPYSQLPSTLMTYLGAWDASANSPSLADGTGSNGDVYRVSVAGTQNLGSGSQTFYVGDFVIYNGTIWQRSPAADGVISVNGNTGAVTVNAINQLTGDVTAGPASGSTSASSSIASIKGTSVSGTTGSGNVVFSAAPTLTGLLSGGSASFSSTISASNFSGSSSGTNTGDQTITLTGDVTGSGTGSFATTISSNSVSNSKLAQMAANTIKGNNTGLSANAADLTVSQVQSMLSIPTSSSPLPVNAGGTGQTSALTQYGLIYGSSTTAQASLAVGTSGQLLVSDGSSAAPAWTNIIAATTTATYAIGTVTTSAAINWSNGSVQTMTLTTGDTCTVTFSGAISGQTIVVEVTNGSSGGTGVITWPTVKWPGGTIPTMTVGTAALDVYTFVYNGSYYVGSAVQNLS
jgi:hypothetical protein